MNVLSTFSGYDAGGWSFRLENIPVNTIGFSEIEKNPIKCLQTNFPDVPQLGSIVGLKERLPKDVKINLITGGFPCQDVSVAGNRDLSKGRTELFNDLCEVIEHTQPEFLWLENVEGILSAKKKGYDSYHVYVLSELRRLGYGVAWKKLNSKDLNNPQNRVRVWYICKKGGWDFMEFQFPPKEKLTIFLKDLLEDDVKDKYYLKEEQVKKLLPEQDVSYCIDANYHKGTNVEQFLKKKRRQIVQVNNPVHSNNRVYDAEGVSQSPRTAGGGDRQPFIVHSLQKRSIERPSMQKALAEGKPLPGGHGHLSKDDGTSFCIDRGCSQGVEVDTRIRKLTPRECMRLMGFHNDEINLDGLSNTAIYSLAGNGWDVTVARKILRQLMKVEDFRRLL